ncbi:DUF4244 domain-containing protein [Cryobacterium inferilacus]|uniref:DUF4244 domain-containing protein n=1 Tax=Cryobacterium inferilacus TaxID=2866629 RepID=UPI0021026133
MSTVSSPSIAPTNPGSRTERTKPTEPDSIPQAGSAAGSVTTVTSVTTAPLTDPDIRDVEAHDAAAPARPAPTHGTGVRPGIIRTRTVQFNTLRALRRMREDRGAATAEYIVATMAAVGFAGLLIVILRGDEVRGILTELVRSALTVG